MAKTVKPKIYTQQKSFFKDEGGTKTFSDNRNQEYLLVNMLKRILVERR